MNYIQRVKNYFENTPDIRYTTIICTADHLDISKNTLSRKCHEEGTNFEDLRQAERVNRFVAAVKINPNITANAMAAIYGLSDGDALRKSLKYRRGMRYAQFKLHILEGKYEMQTPR